VRGQTSTVLLALIGLAIAIATALLAVSVGTVSVSPADTLKVLADHLLPWDVETSASADAIVWNIRAPRVLVALLVGAVLGLAGTVLQGAFRNPIADAQLLGLSATGSVGALIGFWVGYASFGPAFAVLAGAVAGAIGAFSIRWLASNASGDPGRFVLVGIGFGLSVGAIVATASIAIHDPRVPDVSFWFFGGLSAATWPVVGWLFVISALCVAVILPFSRRLDILSLGHSSARHVGVNVAMVLLVTTTAVGAATGASVGAAGVIAFVGLVGGRVSAGLVGPHHKNTMVVSLFAGAVFVMAADVIGRLGGRGFEVPVGLITTIAGGAYLTWLIARNKVAA
jgi:iron complex transport system permease protein